MKKIILSLSLLSAVVLFQPSEAKSQVSVQVNINAQPDWGPTGYDYAPFYYFPDINAYYDVARAMYIFLNSNTGYWYYTRSLPANYRNFNLYNSYKVVVNQPKPYEYNRLHKQEYSRYKGQHNQPIIRDSKDSKYTQRQTVTPQNGQRPGSVQQQPGSNNQQRPNQNNNSQNRKTSSSKGTQNGNRNRGH